MMIETPSPRTPSFVSLKMKGDPGSISRNSPGFELIIQEMDPGLARSRAPRGDG
jgi:hypothetical protein